MNFCDVFGLDIELLGMVPRPVLAVILLFPIEKDESGRVKNHQASAFAGSEDHGVSSSDAGVFYIKQKIGNACGTIALLHAIANNADLISLQENSFLSNLVNDCREKTPDERADYLDERQAQQAYLWPQLEECCRNMIPIRIIDRLLRTL